MAEISAAMVKELREKTGAGMMDCKKALTEAAGDFVKAEELLRKKGVASAAKKGGRVADVGAVDDQDSPGRVLVVQEAVQLGQGLREPGREQLETAHGVVDVRGAGECVTARPGRVVQPAQGLGCDIGLSRRLAGHRLPRWDRAGSVDPWSAGFW